MKAIEYTPELAARWDDFVSKANNGTIFHTQRFLSYHPDDRFEHHHLIFDDRGKWAGVLPGAVAFRDGKRIYASHP